MVVQLGRAGQCYMQFQRVIAAREPAQTAVTSYTYGKRELPFAPRSTRDGYVFHPLTPLAYCPCLVRRIR